MKARRFINKSLLKEYGNIAIQKQSNPQFVIIFNLYLDYLCRILYNLYRWDNLPETMDEIYLEKCLMQDGIAGMFDHPLYGEINTRATWGELGIYDRPIKSEFYTIKFNEYVYVGKDSDNAVLILNNNLGKNYISIALLYAERMADYAITHDINILAQRTPILLDGDETQLEQIAKGYASYVGGSPVIAQRNYRNKKKDLTDPRPLSALKTDAPFVADKIYSQFISILNEFFAMVGINFVNNNKQERMLVDEVNANNQQIQISYSAGLKTRQLAAEQYNKIHGTNITVHHNETIGEIINEGKNIGISRDGEISRDDAGIPDTE